MEDLYSVHPGATIMRDCLIFGTVMEILNSAFRVGLRSACGYVASVYKPIVGKADPYPALHLSYSILSNCFTWVTFLRDLVLSVGVYMTVVYDKTEEVIGGSWRFMGTIASIVGLITCLLEFLKIVQYRFFDYYSNVAYYVFLASYLVWLYMFGNHCASLVGIEEKGMLDQDPSSGADVSDEEPIAVSQRKEVSEEEEEVKKPKKKHRKERKVVSSDDDV